MFHRIQKVLVGAAALAALALGGSALAGSDVADREHHDPERNDDAGAAEVRRPGARNRRA